MSRVVVYTCVFGHTDPLHEPMNISGARFVCFTDRNIGSKNWEIVRVENVEAPTRLSRTYKLTPHKLFPDAEISLWMDASFSLRIPIDDAIASHPETIIRFKHKDRSRIKDEAAEIARIGKAKPEPTFAQLATYQAEGFDTDQNPMQELSCNGVLMRRHTPEIAALNDLWLEQLNRHTLRDQMSLDYCLWKLGINAGFWPGTHDNCPHFKHKHYKRPVLDF